MRDDLFDLIAYAKSRGLRVSAAPAGTARATPEAMRRFREAGVDSLSFSLDGPDEVIHDGFRRVRGTFRRTLKAIEAAREAGVPFQIRHHCLPHHAAPPGPVGGAGADPGRGPVGSFHPGADGPGAELEPLGPQEYEAFLHWLAQLAEKAPFRVKTTEGPQFRRVLAQRRGQDPETLRPASMRARGTSSSPTGGRFTPAASFLWKWATCGRTPSRRSYWESPILQALRDPAQLKGRCGRCPYKDHCGGSRSRAYAVTGDYLAEDPLCGWEPPRRQLKAFPRPEGLARPGGLGRVIMRRIRESGSGCCGAGGSGRSGPMATPQAVWVPMGDGIRRGASPGPVGKAPGPSVPRPVGGR